MTTYNDTYKACDVVCAICNTKDALECDKCHVAKIADYANAMEHLENCVIRTVPACVDSYVKGSRTLEDVAENILVVLGAYLDMTKKCGENVITLDKVEGTC